MKTNKGFTLIEVVLAIAVGLIIIAGVSVGYSYSKKAAIVDNQKNISIPPVQVKDSIDYVNNQYGFRFFLPQDWKGYSIVTGTWSGDTISQSGQAQVASLQGPMISIRNPLWTVQSPYQDIPIMVFTLAQWSNLQQGKFHIGAAPINPSQLGSNTSYVFALPARYNYAYPAGWQEVDQILKDYPLQIFTPTNSNLTTTSVHIDSIMPASGPVGIKVTISGLGFTADNTVLFDKLVAASKISSVANSQLGISFTVPSSIAPDCKTGEACPMFLREVIPGSYSVSVKNENGVSNALNFNITSNTNAVIRKVGYKELNFLIQKINANNIGGLLYTLYPVAMLQGQPKTLNIGDTVGYACEGRVATLTNINTVNQTATFNEDITTAPPGGCPI
jgi:prepilin-type N-terminal cleavage/methylation domain-containing protein